MLWIVYKLIFNGTSVPTIEYISSGPDPKILDTVATDFIRHKQGDDRAAREWSMSHIYGSENPGFYITRDAQNNVWHIYNRRVTSVAGWLYSTVNWTVELYGLFGLLAVPDQKQVGLSKSPSIGFAAIAGPQRPFLSELQNVLKTYKPKTPEEISNFILNNRQKIS